MRVRVGVRLVIHIERTSDVADDATIGDGTTIWHLAQVREHARLGQNCVIGRGAYVGPGVLIGSNVKIQNYALVYEPATIADGAFIGPAVVLTNDVYPRSVDEHGVLKRGGDWEADGVSIGLGASVGARAVVRAGVRIGDWALIGAGAVVVADVPPHGLVVGNPGRRIGWVGVTGRRLIAEGAGVWRCAATEVIYHERDGMLHTPA